MSNIMNRIDEYIAANEESNDIPGYKLQKPHECCGNCEFYNHDSHDCENPQNEKDAEKLSKKNGLDYVVLGVWNDGICPRYKDE